MVSDRKSSSRGRKTTPENGEHYSCWVSETEHQRIQRAAIEIASKGKILDERNRPVELKTGPDGQKRVGKYGLTKFLLLKFSANGVREQRGTAQP